MKTPYRYIPGVSETLRATRRLVRGVAYRGDACWCAVCKRGFSGWRGPDPARARMCHYCGSGTRQKLAALHIEALAERDPRPRRVLVFAPDWGIERLLRGRSDMAVTTTDIAAPNVDVRADITALPFDDGAFDLVLCSHVLEHVPDDGAAMRELCRVTAPGGETVVQVPYRFKSPTTDEDPGVTDPAERARRFGQFDHVRVYGQDIADRLGAAGFRVEVLRPAADLSPERLRYLGVWNDVLFSCAA